MMFKSSMEALNCHEELTQDNPKKKHISNVRPRVKEIC